MITMFQTSGASAGIVKWSCALRIPTTRPFRPSRTTIGNSTWLSPTVRSSSAGVDSSPVSSGISTGATRMNSSVRTVSASRISPASAAASWTASRLRLCSSSSEKTGTNAARERGVGDERADQVRDLEGERERRGRAGRAEVRAGDDLADQAGDARLSPVRMLKIAVLRARRPGRAGPAREVGRVRVGDEVRDRRLGHRAGQQDVGVALRARFRRRSAGRRIPSPRGPSRLALEAGGFALRRRSRGRRVAARPTHRRAL